MNNPPHQKHPKLIIRTGDQARALRKKLGMNQVDFWGRVRTTQSGGSRYESQGRGIPESVLILLQIAYGTEREAGEIVRHLRAKEIDPGR